MCKLCVSMGIYSNLPLVDVSLLVDVTVTVNRQPLHLHNFPQTAGCLQI